MLSLLLECFKYHGKPAKVNSSFFAAFCCRRSTVCSLMYQMAFELVTRQLGLFGLKKGYWVTDKCTHWLEIICSNGTWGALHFTDTCACGRRLLLVFYCVISDASMLPVVRFISFFVSLPFQFEAHSLSFGKCIRGTNEIYGRKLFPYSKQIFAITGTSL